VLHSLSRVRYSDSPYYLDGAIAAMAETYLLNKLKSVEQTFNELNRRLADPDIDRHKPTEFQRVAKSRSSRRSGQYL